MSITEQESQQQQIQLATHERTLRDLAMMICLCIIVLNCFCLLVFSIEIYLGCNMIKLKRHTYRYDHVHCRTCLINFVVVE
jgi:hypothetical protein